MSPGLPVYVAAPYARAAEVLAIHARLSKIACWPVSHWAAAARSCEDFSSPSLVASAIEVNDACLMRAATVLVLAYPGEGGEMFCEVTRALGRGCPVLWTGPRLILSSFRSGVYVCDMGEAMASLEQAARGIALGGSVQIARMRVHGFMRRKAERDVRAVG